MNNNDEQKNMPENKFLKASEKASAAADKMGNAGDSLNEFGNRSCGCGCSVVILIIIGFIYFSLFMH